MTDTSNLPVDLAAVIAALRTKTEFHLDRLTELGEKIASHIVELGDATANSFRIEELLGVARYHGAALRAARVTLAHVVRDGVVLR